MRGGGGEALATHRLPPKAWTDLRASTEAKTASYAGPWAGGSITS